MLRKKSLVALLATLVVVMPARAQTVQTDRRWLPWLGCWQADGSDTGEQGTSASTTCIVPVSGSASVDMLTIARRRVVARDRLDASGRPHAFDGQGCDGMEVVNWSTNHRALIRSDYVCSSGIKGATTTIFAITPSAEWLRVQEVRSGGGTTITISRLQPVELPSVVSATVARAIESQRRSITAARAAVVAPITTAEASDAAATLNASVVRAWILASDPHVTLDAREIAALSTQAFAFDPTPAATMGDVYVSSSVYAPQVAPAYEPTAYPCYALSTLNCAFPPPYSPYTGFGIPLGFAVFRNTGVRGKDGHGFRSWDNGNTRGGTRPPSARPPAGRIGPVVVGRR